MPELPDVAAYIAALESRILGKQLERVRIASVALLRTSDPPLHSADGRTVREIRRIGKRIALGLEGGLWLVIHLMIAGRFHWRPPSAKLTNRNALAAFDFHDGSLVLTEAGTKRRASLSLVGTAALGAIDRGGIDVFTCDLDSFVGLLSARNQTIKRALTDPRLIDGIGNAYSDEILYAARVSPTALTQRLSSEQWQRLFDATCETLQTWIDRLSSDVTDVFPEKVTAFRADMAVHGRYGQRCSRCGDTIRRIRYADNETNYCPTCQTGGRILADRALSRLGINPSRSGASNPRNQLTLKQPQESPE